MAHGTHRAVVLALGIGVNPQSVGSECVLERFAADGGELADPVHAKLGQRAGGLLAHALEPGDRKGIEKFSFAAGLDAMKPRQPGFLRSQAREKLARRDPHPQWQSQIFGCDRSEPEGDLLGGIRRTRDVEVRGPQSKRLQPVETAPQTDEQTTRDLPVALHVRTQSTGFGTELERVEHGLIHRHAGRDRLGAGRLHEPTFARIAADDDRPVRESRIVCPFHRSVETSDFGKQDRTAHGSVSSTSFRAPDSRTNSRSVTRSEEWPLNQSSRPTRKCGWWGCSDSPGAIAISA